MRIASLWIALIALGASGGTLRPELLFEIESIGEDYILGVVGDVELDAEGRVYVLDSQLNDIKVFDPAGGYLRTISRPGEGPGELTEPGQLIVLADGRLLVACRMPRRLVTMWPDGTPADEFPLPGAMRGDGGFLQFAGRCGEWLVLNEDSRLHDGNHETIRYRYMGIAVGTEPVVLAEKSVERRLGGHTVYTSDSWPFGRLATHPEGHAYLATERERYRIQRFDRSLQSVGWIEREYPVHEKSGAELKEERDRLHEFAGEGDVSLPEISRTKPSISGLVARRGGWLFVRSGRAYDAAHEHDIVGAYDVFDARGEFVGSYKLELPVDWEHDTTFWTDEYLLIARNALDAIRSMNAQYMDPEELERFEGGEWDLKLECYAVPGVMRAPAADEEGAG